VRDMCGTLHFRRPDRGAGSTDRRRRRLYRLRIVRNHLPAIGDRYGTARIGIQPQIFRIALRVGQATCPSVCISIFTAIFNQNTQIRKEL
jgi:hypothetical protein